EVTFNPVTLGLQAQYGSAENSAYGAKFADAVFDGSAALTSEWSVSAYARAALVDKLSGKLSFQWFDGVGIYDDAWQVAAGLDWAPVTGLNIVPEVRYTKADLLAGGDVEAWEGRLRFQRSF